MNRKFIFTIFLSAILIVSVTTIVYANAKSYHSLTTVGYGNAIVDQGS